VKKTLNLLSLTLSSIKNMEERDKNL